MKKTGAIVILVLWAGAAYTAGDDVAALAKQLGDGDASVRRKAAIALDKLGPKAKESAAALGEAFLKDKDSEVYRRAALALGKIGKDGLPPLIEGLKTTNNARRQAACKGIQLVGKDAGDAVVPLISLLKEKDPKLHVDAVRGPVVDALAAIGTPAVAPLIAILKENDPKIRNSAVDALGKIGADAEAGVVALAELLNHKDLAVSRIAATALGQIGKSALPILRARLKDKDDAVRANAAHGLAQSSKAPVALLDDLVAALKDTNAEVRSGAAAAIGKIGENAVPGIPSLVDAVPAIPNLVDLFGDKDETVRLSATKALALIGTPVVPVMVRMLDDPDAKKRENAIAVLTQMGKLGNEAAGCVVSSVSDGNEGVRRAALTMLVKLGRDVTPELVKLLKDRNPVLRHAGAAGLAELGPKAASVAPSLIEALKDNDAAVRLDAVRAMRVVKPDVTAVPPLVVLLKDRDGEIRQAAMDALGQFGGRAEPAVPALGEILKGNDDDERRLAGVLLAKIGKASVVVLIAALGDDRPEVRVAACETLAAIGPDAVPAVEKLMALKRDKSFEVRDAAQSAVEKIQGK